MTGKGTARPSPLRDALGLRPIRLEMVWTRWTIARWADVLLSLGGIRMIGSLCGRVLLSLDSLVFALVRFQPGERARFPCGEILAVVRMGIPCRSFGLATPASRDFWRRAYPRPLQSRSKIPAGPFQLVVVCSGFVPTGARSRFARPHSTGRREALWVVHGDTPAIAEASLRGLSPAYGSERRSAARAAPRPGG